MLYSRELINCPFCGDQGFDKVGLKDHLERFCEVYPNVLSVMEERALRPLQNKPEIEKE